MAVLAVLMTNCNCEEVGSSCTYDKHETMVENIMKFMRP